MTILAVAPRFCAFFALYTLGPAYVWSHLHLTTKTSSDINKLSILLAQSHTSDESRMRILMHGLNLMKFSEESSKISTEWNKINKFWAKPNAIYQHAYPNDLLNELATLIFDTIKQTGLSTATPENICGIKQTNEMKVLFNEAWDRFWRKSPEEFRTWEESILNNFKVDLKKQPIVNN